jgi:hypothetical protein
VQRDVFLAPELGGGDRFDADRLHQHLEVCPVRVPREGAAERGGSPSIDNWQIGCVGFAYVRVIFVAALTNDDDPMPLHTMVLRTKLQTQ